MMELVIERWSGPGGTTFRWSLWRDGKRVAMGPSAHTTAAAAEAVATAACIQEFGMRPARVSAL